MNKEILKFSQGGSMQKIKRKQNTDPRIGLALLFSLFLTSSAALATDTADCFGCDGPLPCPRYEKKHRNVKDVFTKYGYGDSCDDAHSQALERADDFCDERYDGWVEELEYTCKGRKRKRVILKFECN